MTRRVGSVLVGFLTTVVLAILAISWSRYAVTDWQYVLAGLADPFLGRSAPWLTVGIGAVLSLVYSLIAATFRAVTRAVARRAAGRGTSATDVPATGRPAAGGGHPRPRWWWPLAAAWGGYLAGSVLTLAAGGPIDHP